MTTAFKSKKTGWPILKNGTPLNQKQENIWADFCSKLDAYTKPEDNSAADVQRKNKDLTESCTNLDRLLENHLSIKTKKDEKDENFLYGYFINDYAHHLYNLSEDDKLRKIVGNELSRILIFKKLFKEIGLHLLLLNFNFHELVQNQIQIKINDQIVTRQLNRREHQISFSFDSLFEIISALTEICAFVFSNHEETSNYKTDLLNIKHLAAVSQKIERLDFTENTKSIFPNLKTDLSALVRICSKIDSQIKEITNWRDATEEAIDLTLRFYIFDKKKKEHLDEELLKDLISSSITYIKKLKFKPYKSYKNNIKPIIRDARNKHSSSKKAMYPIGTFTSRNRAKKIVTSAASNSTLTTITDSKLPCGKSSQNKKN